MNRRFMACAFQRVEYAELEERLAIDDIWTSGMEDLAPGDVYIITDRVLLTIVIFTEQQPR